MTTPAYLVQGLRHRLGESFCLDVSQLSVAAGDVLALLGPTGAGKTTLLRLLTGIHRVDGGRIALQGRELRTCGESELRRIAMVHQRPALLRGTVCDNVAVGLRIRRQSGGERVTQILEQLGLARLAQQDARSLSGGQMQLVALARALVIEPQVLLLDEPTANLDPSLTALVETTIARTRAERGLTVVWSTHNLFQARRVSQQVALLLDGALVEVAETNQFFDEPADSRSEAFIHGKMVY